MFVLKSMANMMHAYSTIIQVFVNLHPLNICMSYSHTLRILEKLSEKHDEKVKVWADELTDLIEKPPERVSVYGTHVHIFPIVNCHRPCMHEQICDFAHLS